MNRIKLLRNAQTPKMSQGQLANLVGVGRTTVTMWENGANEPDNATLIKLAEIFHVSVEYLLGNDANEEYSQRFRDDVLCALESNTLSGDEDCMGDEHRAREMAESTGRLFFDDVCAVARNVGISIDDLIWNRDNTTKKGLDGMESRLCLSPERLQNVMGEMTCEEFSQQYGFRASTISEYLSGNRKPIAATITDMADTLGINAKWLCGLDVPKYKKSVPNNEDGPNDEQEQRIMNLVGQMNTVQKDFLLALLHTVVVQNQGTPASDLASVDEAILKSEHLC